MAASSNVQIIDGDEEGFYERVLQKGYKRLSEFVEEKLPASDNPRGDLIEVYKAQISDLHEVIKQLESKLTALKLKTSEEMSALVTRHEQMMQQIRNEHEVEMVSLNQQHSELVDEIIQSQIYEIELWKREFVSHCEQQGDCQAVVPTRNQGLAAELFLKLNELNGVQKGLVVVGMTVVTMAVGFYSWRFISWAWPRLIAFAARIPVASVSAWIFPMMNLGAFKNLIKAWKDGEPLEPALFYGFGAAIMTEIVAMAPRLFRG